MTSALNVSNLTRFYGEFCALKETNFSIESGSVVVVTGLNGAGKSTMLMCLAGLLRPSNGNVVICGHDLYLDEVEAKRCLAFVPDVPRFYLELTAWEHLKFMALAYDAEEGFEKRVQDILTELDLWGARDLYPHNYSRGMRLKLGLALALVHPFKVLLLDEPTSALDPQAVDYLVWKLLQLRDRGIAILLTSHNIQIISALHARQWHMESGVLEQNT